MKVLYPKPSERIAAYVEAILIIKNDEVTSPFTLPIFANGKPTLLFSTAAVQIGNSSHHLVLFGQTVLPQHLFIPDKFMLIAYFLKPFALGALFKVTASQLTDRPVALNLLEGRSNLEEQLLNNADRDDILQLMDDHLYARALAGGHENSRLVYAANKIARTSDKFVLTSVQRELQLTERTFQRMFEQHIGVSPNLFRRINQFNRAFNQVNTGYFNDLSTLAYTHGYADQSHFNRAFKEFTSLTPSGYLGIRPDL